MKILVRDDHQLSSSCLFFFFFFFYWLSQTFFEPNVRFCLAYVTLYERIARVELNKFNFPAPSSSILSFVLSYRQRFQIIIVRIVDSRGWRGDVIEYKYGRFENDNVIVRIRVRDKVNNIQFFRAGRPGFYG